MNRFSTLDKTRLYSMIKDNNTIFASTESSRRAETLLPIFDFVVDSDNNIRVLTGHMKGYIIEPNNQTMFPDSVYKIIDIGEAPTVATIKVTTAKGRPRTPE
jgi:hypothetical protein